MEIQSIMKYVITLAGPIIFSPDILHADTVQSKEGIISAGFFFIKQAQGKGNIICYGESTSLNIKSRGMQDASIIGNYLGLQ